MSSLTLRDMFLRLVMAFVAGFIVGWEREKHGRPAGLRTNILACVASALAMIVSEVLFNQSANASWRPDPARLGAGVLTGIGFLGAGTILRHENVIWGVTTAASLWFVTVLGLAFGSGQFLLGFMGVGLALLILYVLPRFEKYIESDRYATVTVVAGLEGLHEQELQSRISGLGPKIQATRLSYDLEKKQRLVTFDLKLSKSNVVELSNKVVREVAGYPGVLRVRWS